MSNTENKKRTIQIEYDEYEALRRVKNELDITRATIKSKESMLTQTIGGLKVQINDLTVLVNEEKEKRLQAELAVKEVILDDATNDETA